MAFEQLSGITKRTNTNTPSYSRDVIGFSRGGGMEIIVTLKIANNKVIFKHKGRLGDISKK